VTEDAQELARWMMRRGFVTGHQQTVKELLQELDWQITQLREAVERMELREAVERKKG
jgi:O-methyltransferase involved in polyketide biosynthesis